MLKPITRIRLYNLVMALILITWMIGPRLPGLDFALMITAGAWITALGVTGRQHHAIDAPVDDPMLVTRKLRDLTMQQHGLAPTPTPTLPTCTDRWIVPPSKGGGLHCCTSIAGHGGLHEVADPDDPTLPPHHRWYRLRPGKAIGW